MMIRLALGFTALLVAAPAWAQGVPEVMVSRADSAAFPAGRGTVELNVRVAADGVVQDCTGSASKAPLVEASCRLLRERGWFWSAPARNADRAEKIRFNWSPPRPDRPDIFDGGAGMISPASWVRPDDYPADALERGEKGLTVVEFDVSDKGAITSCTVVKSSGSRSLDDTTCRNFLARGRYFPAGDGAGGRKATRARVPMDWRRR